MKARSSHKWSSSDATGDVRNFDYISNHSALLSDQKKMESYSFFDSSNISKLRVQSVGIFWYDLEFILITDASSSYDAKLIRALEIILKTIYKEWTCFQAEFSLPL